MPVPQGDPAALERLAAELDGHASDMDGLASSTARTAADVKTNADWSGSAADGFTGFSANLTHGAGSVQAPLTKIASSVRGYAGYLRTAQEKVSAYNSSAELAAATQHPVHTAAARAAGQDAHSAVAEANAAGDQAAREIDEARRELENPFGADGVVREWIEKLHAPWDIALGDVVVAKAMAQVEEGEELSKEITRYLKGMPQLLDNNEAELESVLRYSRADFATRAGATDQLIEDSNGIWKWAHGLGEGAEELTRYSGLWRGIGVASDGAGAIGDAFVLAKPEDDGAMGDVDRGVAAANLGLSVADGAVLLGASFSVPVAGQVALIGTGVYLGADYLYHHWQPFHNVCDDVGHTAASIGKSIWHGLGL